MNLKKFVLKIVCVVISTNIIKLEDFDIDNIWIDAKSWKYFDLPHFI